MISNLRLRAASGLSAHIWSRPRSGVKPWSASELARRDRRRHTPHRQTYTISGAVVAIGTPVHIVNQPYKVGVAHNKIYLEVHPHLAEDRDIFRDQFSHVVELIVAKTAGRDVQLNWRVLQKVIVEKSGIPISVGVISDPERELDKITQLTAPIRRSDALN